MTLGRRRKKPALITWWAAEVWCSCLSVFLLIKFGFKLNLCTIRPGLHRHIVTDVAGQRSQGVAEWAAALM